MSALVGKQPLLQCWDELVAERQVNCPVSVICLFCHKKQAQIQKHKPQALEDHICIFFIFLLQKEWLL